MPFIVTVLHNGNELPLRGTIIAYNMNRAQEFATREAAQAAIVKCKPFHKASIWKKLTIKERNSAD